MPSPVRSAPVRGAPSLPPVHVTFYRRMKIQRVYAFTARWQKGSTPVAGQKVTLRLLMAGAQVLPAEQTLDAGKSDATATFFVTPLARGWLRGVRMEIIHEGRKVQEVPLASKAMTQRLALFFLLMTFLAPWFVNANIKHSSFRETAIYIEPRAALGIDARGYKIVKDNVSRDDILKDVQESFRDNVPEMPGFLHDLMPSLKDQFVAGRGHAAGAYADIIMASQDQPYALYAGLIFLGLAVLSAASHADMRRKRPSKPIPLAGE